MSDRIDALLRQAMAAQHLPGLALAIQQGEKLVYAGYLGSANLEHGVPVTAQTVFEIASVTKVFTAQAIMRLAEQNRLRLDDPLAHYIPDLPVAWGGVTLRHCLAHRSGIPSYTGEDAYWAATQVDKTPREVLGMVAAKPLSFVPGDRYSYDNTGFYLLGMVIEAASGESYAGHLQRVIFTPLGMTATRSNDYAAVISQRAQGYTHVDGVLRNKPYYSISNTYSAGMLLSTVPDLLRWRASLFNDSILNLTSRTAWWTVTPSAANNERAEHFSLGLGWFLVDSPLGQFWGHNGGITGFAASFMSFPDSDITAVVLCNGSINAPHELAFPIINDLVKGAA